MIPFTDTSTDPGAMVVKFHYTIVADVAVARAGRPKYKACLTEL